jgi:hypothetical protein
MSVSEQIVRRRLTISYDVQPKSSSSGLIIDLYQNYTISNIVLLTEKRVVLNSWCHLVFMTEITVI